MKRKHIIWTPDEILEEAKAVVEVLRESFADKPKPAEPKPVPELLPKPARPQPPVAVLSVSVAELRRAQKRERARKRFSTKVRKNLQRKSKELNKALRTQGRMASASLKHAQKAFKAQEQNKTQQALRAKAQAEAAVKAAEAARKAAQRLREQIAAAIAWLRAERAHQRRLDKEARARIQDYRTRKLLPSWLTEEDLLDWEY
jgi:hypothetical protein